MTVQAKLLILWSAMLTLVIAAVALAVWAALSHGQAHMAGPVVALAAAAISLSTAERRVRIGAPVMPHARTRWALIGLALLVAVATALAVVLFVRT